MSELTKRIELTQKEVDHHHRFQSISSLQLLKLLALRQTKLAVQEKRHSVAHHPQATQKQYQQAAESKKQQFPLSENKSICNKPPYMHPYTL